jgi:hypothetical protein
MSFRQSIFGEVATYPDQGPSVVDVGLLVRRLILFDKVIVKSALLREIPALVRAIGTSGFTRLLDTGLMKLSCELTSVITDVSRNGVRHVPLYHFSFGVADLADRDASLRSALRCLHGISGLKNLERASMEEAILRSLVRPPSTYGQALLDQIDSDLRTNTPGFKTAIRHRLIAELGTSHLPVADLPIDVEETTKRVFHVKNTLSDSFGISPEKAHIVLHGAVTAMANLNQRLANMEAYSAITGFLDSESTLLFGKLAGIIAPLNPNRAEEQFERVIEIADVPDFRPGQRVDVDLLLKVRESAECREFREWLSTLEDVSDAEIKEMVASIKSKMASLAASASGKLVRLAATTGIGLIPVVGPITGAAASAIDSFLVDRVLPRSGIVAFLAEKYPSLFVSA